MNVILIKLSNYILNVQNGLKLNLNYLILNLITIWSKLKRMWHSLKLSDGNDGLVENLYPMRDSETFPR